MQIFYKNFIKPIFFSFKPETAHEILKKVLPLTNPFLNSLASNLSFESTNLEVKLENLHFSNPLGLAAGFDKTGELYPYLSKMGFGFIEIGTVTGEAQDGNDKPRIFRFQEKKALINRLGFNNDGALKTYERLKNQKKTIIRGINVGKTKVVSNENASKDYLKSLNLLSPIHDYATINISSPNTENLRMLQEKANLKNLLSEIFSNLDCKIPIFIKLAPDLDKKSLLEIFELIFDFPISGLILTNTSIEFSKEEYREKGGLSGVPIQKKSTEIIRFAYKEIGKKIPIIGVGGIFCPKSALEKILAGASLIQIYTGYIYEGPYLVPQILKYLDQFLKKNKIQSIQKIVGKESDF